MEVRFKGHEHRGTGDSKEPIAHYIVVTSRDVQFQLKPARLGGRRLYVFWLITAGMKRECRVESRPYSSSNRVQVDIAVGENRVCGQLDAHIKELTSGPYTVLPVPKIVERLIKGEVLPNRTVGITIDDAYRSVYEVAWPKFKAAGLPITIFASTANLDSGSGRHMNWEQLREMVERGASVGHHTVSHLHMVNSSLKLIDKELTAAHVRFEKELGFRPRLFSYPYGIIWSLLVIL